MVDRETHLSSFFMLLLSATSLIVILSNFFSGNFNMRSSAKSYDPVEEYMESEELYMEETYLENSEEVMEADEEEVMYQSEPSDDLNMELDTSISPDVQVETETDY